jgi:CSLREA domain-containing protein
MNIYPSCRILLSFFMLAIVTLVGLTGPSLAATIAVDTTADDNMVNGNCTLREAIISANLQGATDACTAGDGSNDTIDLTAVTGTITLGSKLPAISANVRITGPGATSLAISGNNSVNVIEIFGGGNAKTVTITGLTITEGKNENPGGGIIVNPGDTMNLSQVTVSYNSALQGAGLLNNGGTATIKECMFLNNTSTSYGAGIYNGGPMDIADSLISGNNSTSGNGGGIYSLGTLNIDRTAVHQNTSGGTGGGISNDGPITIQRSTVSLNTAALLAGGILNQGGGTLTNVTVSDSTGDGVVVTAADNASLSMTNCTVANNTGTGLLAMKNSTIYNSIIAKNGTDCNGAVISAGHNISGDSSCGFTATGDQQNTDPLLGLLSDYGGGITTLPLLDGSPAIDRGDNAGAPETDARGVRRPQNGDRSGAAVTDVGAYELLSSMKVLMPNGGETLPSGGSTTITWGGPNKAVKFKPRYSINGGLTWIPITTDYVTDYSYRWNVPVLGKNTKTLVRVIGYTESNVKVGMDSSDKPALIEVVKLLTPSDSGIQMVSYDQYLITWSTNITKAPVQDVKISLTNDGGLTWKTILAHHANTGEYLWTVPKVARPKKACKVRVQLFDIDGKSLGSDSSDSFFTIQP